MVLPVSKNLSAAALSDIELPRIPTGIQPLDQILTGGVPRGRITEICGSVSSGKTSLLFAILAQVTSNEELAAYVDTFNAFDPGFASRNRIQLENLLWVRCGGPQCRTKALQAVDLLSRSQGFSVVVLHLDPVPAQKLGSISTSCWYRLRRIIERTQVSLIVLSPKNTTGSAASISLTCQRCSSHWDSIRAEGLRKSNFTGIDSAAQLLRGRNHGRITVHCHF